jgi:hypothetical protein
MTTFICCFDIVVVDYLLTNEYTFVDISTAAVVVVKSTNIAFIVIVAIVVYICYCHRSHHSMHLKGTVKPKIPLKIDGKHAFSQSTAKPSYLIICVCVVFN